MSLVASILVAILLFCLYTGATISGRNSPLKEPGTSGIHLPFQNSTEISISESRTTPKPTLVFTPTPKPVAKPAPTPHKSILPSVLHPGIYYGVHVSTQDIPSVMAFEANAQKPVSIVMWYQHWGVTNGYQYFQPGWMDAIRAHGSIPLVTWDPWDPSLGADQPTYTLQNIINGNFDSYITAWAQASKVWGHPYFLRFAPEMNGNWNPWSEQVNGNKPGQYVLAWRHVHDIFTNLGVTNVTWVWCPNIDFSVSTPLKGLYPGDAYVDWVGMDGYNWGTVQAHTWQPFFSLFQQTYKDVLSITSRPLMIAETASTEQAGNKASWITDAYMQLPRYFPLVKAVVWFNQDKETDWAIESSPAAQSAFATAIQSRIYASNSYANLNTSPIPVL
jgi:Glycosyl hydrolase family 26